MEDLKIAAKFCILPIIFQELPKVSRVEDFDEINSQVNYSIFVATLCLTNSIFSPMLGSIR